MDISRGQKPSDLEEGKKWALLAIIYVGLLVLGPWLGYALLILVAESFEAAWVLWWMDILAPYADQLNALFPGVETRLNGIADAGFGRRVPLLSHLYATSLVIGCSVGFVVSFIWQARTDDYSDRFGMNAASLFGFFGITLGLGFVFWLHLVRDIVPAPTDQYLVGSARIFMDLVYLWEVSLAGYVSNFEALFETCFYVAGFVVAGGGAATFIMAFIRPFIHKDDGSSGTDQTH